MSDDKLRTDLERASRAERLLTDELLVEAFTTLAQTYHKAWESTQPRDTDGRERLWQAVQIVGKVESHLRSVVANGELAQNEIKNLERMGERRKMFGIV